jgi:PKD repeat protein
MKKTLLVLFTLQLMASQLFAQNFLINEGFGSATGTTPPTNWGNITITGDGSLDKWKFNNPLGYQYPAPISDPAAFVDSYNSGNGGGVNNNLPENVALVSPTVSTVGLSDLTLDFDHFMLFLANANGVVEVTTNGGTTWTQVFTYNTTPASTQKATINLNAYINNTTFAFRIRWNQPASASNNGYWIVDNVRLYSKYATDASVTAAPLPQNLSCPSPAQGVSITVTNTGTGALSNIPVTVQYSGAASATFSTTISSLAAGTSTTVFTTNTINTSSGGTLNITAYTTLSGDQTALNDTFRVSRQIAATPTNPIGTNVTRCGSGTASLTVAATAADSTDWFATASSGIVIGEGNPFTTPFNYSTTSYFVENSRLLFNSITTTFNGPWRYNGITAHGNAFNVVAATSDILVDSFDLNFAYAGTYTVEVFYRAGGYIGYETSANGWISAGTQSVTSAGLGVPCRFTGGKFRVPAGSTYGVYIKTSGSNCSFGFKQGSLNFANSDITVQGGYVAPGAFVAGLTGYTWDGNIYFRKVCKSARQQVDVIINNRPVGANLYALTPFKGSYKSGSANNPDIAYVGETIKYGFTPPTGFTNAGFGTTWILTGLSFQTPYGFAPNSGDTATTFPGANDGTFTFTSSAGVADSTYILTILYKNLATNCDSFVTRYIYVAPKPVPGFYNTLPCNGQTISFTDTSYILKGSIGYQWSFGDPASTTSNQENPTFTYATAGTYTVKLIVTSDLGHKDSVTKQITVHPTPVSNFSYGNSCIGDSTVFTNKSTIASSGSISSYEWTFGNNTSSAAVSPKTLYNQAQGYNVWLVAQSNNGCRDSIMKVVYVFPRPVAGFSTSNICKGSQASFTNNSTISNGILGYNWTFGDGNSAHDLNPQHAYSTVGTYTVKLKVYSAVGCLDSISKSITVADKPIAGFTVANICDNDSVSFTDATNFAGTGMTQTWSFGDGNTTNKVGSVKHFYNNHGTYTATLTATAGNCSDTKTVEIDVKEAPQALFTSTGNICVNSPFSFSNTSDEPTGATTTYLWTFGNSTTSTQKNGTAIYATAGNYNVTLVATSSNNCTDTEVKSYTAYALPVISFDTNYLSGLRQVQLVPSNTTYYSYEWNMDDGNTSNQVSPVHTYLSNGPFNVKLKVEDNNGCMNNATSRIVGFNVSDGKELISGSAINVFPNPFKGSTNIKFTLTRNAQVKVTVYDMLGKELGILLSEELNSGNHSTSLNSEILKSHAGIYLIKVEVDGEAYTKQVVQVN